MLIIQNNIKNPDIGGARKVDIKLEYQSTSSVKKLGILHFH